jgi:hypothetical protein
MTQVIIYPHQNGQGGVELLIPSGELPIDEVAKKDVPAGLPYLILDQDILPDTYEFFDAWEADFSNPDGYGASYGNGTELAVVEYINGLATRVRNENTGEVSFTEYGNQLVAEGIYDNNQP